MKLFFIIFTLVIIMIGCKVCVAVRQNDYNNRHSPNTTYNKQKSGNYTTNSLSQRTNSTIYSTTNNNGYNVNYYNANTVRLGNSPTYTTNTHTQIVPTNTHTSYQTPRPGVMTQTPVYYPPAGGYNYNNNGRPVSTPSYSTNTPHIPMVPVNYNPSYQTASLTLSQMPAVSYLLAGPSGYYMCHNHGQPVTPFVYPVGYKGQSNVNNAQYPSYSSYLAYNQPGAAGPTVANVPIPYQHTYVYGKPNTPIPVRSSQSPQSAIPPAYVTGPHGQPCTFVYYQNVAPMG